MKPKHVKSMVAASILAISSSLQAFVIDFNSLTVPLGTVIDAGNPLVVNVAGYGDVRLEVGGSTQLEVGSSFANESGQIVNSLEIDAGEAVLVTFLGADALNVDFDVIGQTPGLESVQITSNAIRTNEYQLTLIGGSGVDGVGLASVSWDAAPVPEPSSSVLVGLGGSLLLLRRRRN